MQSLQGRLRRVAEYVLQDGRKVALTPVIAEIDGDDIHVDVRLPVTSIYIAGLVHDVVEAHFALPRDGDVGLGVRVTRDPAGTGFDIGLRGRPSRHRGLHGAGRRPPRRRLGPLGRWDRCAAAIPVYTMRNGAILSQPDQHRFLRDLQRDLLLPREQWLVRQFGLRRHYVASCRTTALLGVGGHGLCERPPHPAQSEPALHRAGRTDAARRRRRAARLHRGERRRADLFTLSKGPLRWTVTRASSGSPKRWSPMPGWPSAC